VTVKGIVILGHF